MRSPQITWFNGVMKGFTTPQLLKATADGTKEARPVFGAPVGQKAATHQPRTKFDPKPWTDGFFRYHAWELHPEEVAQ